MSKSTIKKSDIQRLAAYGFKSDWVRHLILRVESPDRAREFLKNIVNNKQITHAGDNSVEESSVASWKMNISFTYSGLKRLGLNRHILLNAFPSLAKAFVQGAGPRAQLLGDVGANAPQRWETCFKPSNAHLVLTVFATEDDGVWEDILKQLRKHEGADGLCGWEDAQHGQKREGDVEVFGFKDGISQPYFRGVSKKPKGPIPESLKFEPGELLLGYKNELGANSWDDENLPEEAGNFFKNGTFAAFRKIEQDLEKFTKVTGNLAKEHGVVPEYIQAKFFGRWKSGAIVKPGQRISPGEPPEKLENSFDFADDPSGYGCPFGSHIRRINHRANTDVFPNRHRAIQRRGLPYGNADGTSKEQGLLGLFFCASLESQFEFVMGDWVEGTPRMHSANRALNSDPVIGNQCNGEKAFYIPRKELDSIKLSGLRQFTTTKGVLYLFYPSMKALERMAISDVKHGDFVYAKKVKYEERYVSEKETA